MKISRLLFSILLTMSTPCAGGGVSVAAKSASRCADGTMPRSRRRHENASTCRVRRGLNPVMNSMTPLSVGPNNAPTTVGHNPPCCKK